MIDSTSDCGPVSRPEAVTPVSLRVVEAVADAKGVDPVELDPLYDTVDPEAVDDVFAPQSRVGSVPDSAAELSFTYHGYDVRVTATGLVSVSECAR